MANKKFEEQAKRLCSAIEYMADNDNALENFNSYLSYHFDVWLNEYVNNNVENFISEIELFAHMYD